jgi:hypothetical protein
MTWLDALRDILAPAVANDDQPPPRPALRVVRSIEEGMFRHWSEYDWPVARWPNFTAQEIACSHCGELYIDIASIDMIQKARDILGPIRLNSAHRCIIHNSHVGGAINSQHKKIAFDVSVQGRDRQAVLQGLQQAGFTTFGFYQTFVHTDIRPGRSWVSGPKARALWGL